MGQGAQETGMMARGARTGIEMVLRTEDLLAAILSSKTTKEAELFMNHLKEGGEIKCDVAIPVDKIAEFADRMQAHNIPFMIVDHKEGTIKDVNAFDRKSGPVDELDVKTEYVTIMYRGIKPKFEENGEITLDQNGRKIATNNSERESIVIKQVASEINANYLKELSIESQEKAHELSSLEANKKFIDQKTIKIEMDNLSELYLVQQQTNKQGIDSQVLVLGNDKYALEVDADYAERVNPGDMSPLETALVDAELGLRHPDVAKYVEEKSKTSEEIADIVYNLKQGNTDIQKTIISLDRHLPNNYKQVTDYGRLNRIEINGTNATVWAYDKDATERADMYKAIVYDLTDSNDFHKFETRLQRFDNAIAIDKGDLIEASKSELQYENFKAKYDIDRLQETISKFQEIKDSAFGIRASFSEEINKDQVSKDWGHLEDDPNRSGYKTMELRIEDTSEIITDNIAKKTNGEIDKDQIKDILEKNETRFVTTPPKAYEPTTYFVGKFDRKMAHDVEQNYLDYKEMVNAKREVEQEYEGHEEMYNDLDVANDQEIDYDTANNVLSEYYAENPDEIQSKESINPEDIEAYEQFTQEHEPNLEDEDFDHDLWT